MRASPLCTQNLVSHLAGGFAAVVGREQNRALHRTASRLIGGGKEGSRGLVINPGPRGRKSGGAADDAIPLDLGNLRGSLGTVPRRGFVGYKRGLNARRYQGFRISLYSIRGPSRFCSPCLRPFFVNRIPPILSTVVGPCAAQKSPNPLKESRWRVPISPSTPSARPTASR